MITGSFLSGSRAYGFPREDSDVDIIIRCSPDDVKLFNDKITPSDTIYENDELKDSIICRIENINYILCLSDKTFNTWKQGTEELIKIKPVTRDIAVEKFKKLRGVK